MRRYHFTGHLSPLPPGIRLPLELSGEVYLVSEVEAELKARDIAHQREIAQLHERIRKVTFKSMNFRKRRPRKATAVNGGEQHG